MAEETEGQNTGAEAVAGGVAGADPAAVALALNAANIDPSIAEDARAYLRKHSALADEQQGLVSDQRHYVRERYKQLVEQVEETWLRVWALRLTVLLRVATAVVGIAVAVGLAFMVWDAAHSNGLRIEPFSVPPDLAQRGLTGQVVAARVIDRLNFMQAHTNTARPARSYSNSWGEDGIKLEIPESGISLAELNSWLREKIGNDAYVTGEVVRAATGITVTARTGEQSTETVSGADADIDTLVGKQTASVRAAQSYVNNAGDDIRVELPETGMSLAEIERYLRERLGHPTHITGEITRSGSELKLTARASVSGSGTVSSSESELDVLIQGAAEAVYRITEPRRYSTYLLEHGREHEVGQFLAATIPNASFDEAQIYYLR